MTGAIIILSLPIATLLAFVGGMPKVGILLGFVTLALAFLILG